MARRDEISVPARRRLQHLGRAEKTSSAGRGGVNFSKGAYCPFITAGEKGEESGEKKGASVS